MMQAADRVPAIPDTQSQRTAMLRQKLAYVRGDNHSGDNHSGRASRFKNIMAGGSKVHENQSFDCVASLPDWIVLDTVTQDLIGVCAAILNERSAIDRELSGERLSAISAIVGNALFEDLCEVSLPPQTDKVQNVDFIPRLSRPEDFTAIGQELRIKAMRYTSRQSEDENYPRILCDIAAYVVSGCHVNRDQTHNSRQAGEP